MICIDQWNCLKIENKIVKKRLAEYQWTYIIKTLSSKYEEKIFSPLICTFWCLRTSRLISSFDWFLHINHKEVRLKLFALYIQLNLVVLKWKELMILLELFKLSMWILLTITMNGPYPWIEFICCFSTKHAALRRKSKDCLARNQDNVSKWGDMCIRRPLFQLASTIQFKLSMLV